MSLSSCRFIGLLGLLTTTSRRVGDRRGEGCSNVVEAIMSISMSFPIVIVAAGDTADDTADVDDVSII